MTAHVKVGDTVVTRMRLLGRQAEGQGWVAALPTSARPRGLAKRERAPRASLHLSRPLAASTLASLTWRKCSMGSRGRSSTWK